MTPSPVVELKIAGQPCAERGGCFVRMEIHILVFDAAPEPLDERSCESTRFGLCRTCGRSARAVGRYSPPGCEKQPGRPVQPRGGDPGRSQRQRGPSLVRPDDGPCSGREITARRSCCHQEFLTEFRGCYCVLSSVAAGHSCGPAGPGRRYGPAARSSRSGARTRRRTPR